MKDTIYDNSNIAESYAGVTTPLTFSFVKFVYKGVYSHFSKLMGINDKTINKNEEMYSNMVAFIGNRIYYNLTNWYVMLSLFPAYKFSSNFMEKMMGVDESFSAESTQISKIEKIKNLPITIYLLIRIFIVFGSLKFTIPKFSKYFEEKYSELNSIELSDKTPEELIDIYDLTSERLLSKWRIPIANDFAVMVSAGLSDKLFKKWIGSKNAYNYMKSGRDGSIITLDPGEKLLNIADQIQNETKIKTFINNSDEITFSDLEKKFPNSEITKEIGNYIDMYKDRMPSELKLETKTLAENTNEFFIILKNILKGDNDSELEIVNTALQNDLEKVSLIKRLILKYLTSWAAISIKRREDARFYRTLIFGFVRKIFLNIADDFYKNNLINRRDDIYFLTVDEIRSYVKNGNLFSKDELNKRKGTLDKWKNIEVPKRIESGKSIYEIEEEIFLTDNNLTEIPSNTTSISGNVASKPNGISNIKGKIISVKTFDPDLDYRNKILVTVFTDPGWTIVFPLLKGIIVERGGMLSHAAIVARELNIPCIVGATNATDVFKMNDTIEINLDDGSICKMK